jgi:hypothetical protein
MSETTDATDVDNVSDAPVEADESAGDPTGPNGPVEPDDDQAAFEDTAEEVEDESEQPVSNAEAAKFRRRLRDTEKDRDQLAARVEALQRKHVEAMLASTGVKAAAVFSVTDLDALVDADGTVNAERVTAAVNTARDRFNIAPIGKGAYVPGIGNHPGMAPKVDAFSDAFKPSRKRR